jgi:hypothetical protein
MMAASAGCPQSSAHFEQVVDAVACRREGHGFGTVALHRGRRATADRWAVWSAETRGEPLIRLGRQLGFQPVEQPILLRLQVADDREAA